MSWKNVLNINKLEYEDWAGGDTYEAKYADISDLIGTEKLGFHLEILPPGKFTRPYHFHHSEEEVFLVIEGKAILRQNNQYREVKTGDLIHFQSGPEGAHQYYNHTDQGFKFLALSTKDDLDVAEYPDSQKVLFRKAKKTFQFEKEVPYLTDEETPQKFWDAKYFENSSDKS